MAILSQCFRIHLGLSSPDSRLLRSQGYSSVPGPSESQVQCPGLGGPAPFGLSALLIAALSPAPSVLFIGLRPVSR